MAASDRLREMRAQMEAQSAELLGEESGATEISIGGTKLKLDDEDRKTLLRRPTTQARPGELSTCRICTVIAVTVVACLALLWALFHGGTPQFYSATDALEKDMKPSTSAANSDECPDELWWLPDECIIGDERLRHQFRPYLCHDITGNIVFKRT